MSARIRCALALSLLLAALGTARGAPAREAYDMALEARRADRLEEALDHLARARAERPRDPDVLLLTGQVLGFLGRYQEALAVLRDGLAVAPDYADLKLAEARVLSYEGRFDEAGHVVETVLARDPGNVEALALSARLAWYRRDLARARAGFEDLLKRRPDDLDGLVGLGDVAAAEGRRDEALALYRRAEAVDPSNADVQGRLAAGAAEERPWRLDLGAGLSRLERPGSRDPWRVGALRLARRLGGATEVHAAVEAERRGAGRDVYAEAGVARRIAPGFDLSLALGGTPAADFREDLALRAGARWRLMEGEGTFAGTTFTLDLRHARYGSDGINQANPGIEQYFLDGRAWVTLRLLGTRDAGGTWRSGWSVRADAELGGGWRLGGGYADASEPDGGRVIDVRTLFGGVAVDLTPDLTLRLDGFREDRGRGVDRVGGATGLTMRF